MSSIMVETRIVLRWGFRDRVASCVVNLCDTKLNLTVNRCDIELNLTMTNDTIDLIILIRNFFCRDNTNKTLLE
jgi:hypothetical protein